MACTCFLQQTPQVQTLCGVRCGPQNWFFMCQVVSNLILRRQKKKSKVFFLVMHLKKKIFLSLECNVVLFTAQSVLINLNHHTWFGVLSCCSAKSHLSMCSPGLRSESASAARHVRARCHQAGGNPPSRRETPPPRASVSHEVSSTPSWRHRRFHQRGKTPILTSLWHNISLITKVRRCSNKEFVSKQRIWFLLLSYYYL